MGDTSWDGLVVMAAAVPWHGSRMSEGHLATHLSRYVPVLYADPPLSSRRIRSASQLRGGGPDHLEPVGPQMLRLAPVVMAGKSRPGLRDVADFRARTRLRKAVRALTDDVRAVISVAPHRPQLGCCDERTSVYWVLDDYEAGADLIGVPRGRVVRGERRIRRRADVVLAVSTSLVEREERHGVRAGLLSNGCDFDRLAGARRLPAPADVTLARPIVGYVGGLSDRIELPLLEAVAGSGRSLLIVGPASRGSDRGRFGPLLRRDNVQWVGGKPFDELPAYLGQMDVGLVPYADTPFNRASFPLKTLEYLAAGSRVVSTPLPAVRSLRTDLVDLADGWDFADAVEVAARTPLEADEVAVRQAFAATHSWDARAKALLALLGD